jgi:hypothetical protein
MSTYRESKMGRLPAREAAAPERARVVSTPRAGEYNWQDDDEVRAMLDAVADMDEEGWLDR